MKLCPKCNKQFSDDANFCPVDAARLVALEGQAAAAAPDSLSSRFDLGAPLGGTRTGPVYRATDRQGGAAVAVKLVSAAVVTLPGIGSRVERELKQLERVQSAGVAKVLASGKRGDDTWVAYELLEGAQTLADAIGARGPIPLDQAAHLIEVVGEALIEAAQVGVVHRDLAPKNVLFAGDQIKLINFSLPVPTSDKVPGVPEFVAPEQVDGKPVDQRSNLYSLGALYYYVLTGQTVHAGDVLEVHKAHVSGTIKTPSSLAPVPAPVEAVIMRALDRSPTKRFLTVRQFVDEVGRVARGEADPRATQPLGKAGRPKAELVQTLLGVRSGGASVPALSTPIMGSNAQSGPSPRPGTAPPVATPRAGTAPPVAAPIAAPVAAPVVAPVAAPVVAPVAAPVVAPVATPRAGTAPPDAARQAPSPVIPPPMGAPSSDRSPWAPPAASPAAPVAQAPAAVAAPEPAKVAAISQAAQVVAPPVVANAPTGRQTGKQTGKHKKKAEGDTKGRFRETLWFKKGDLDAQAAVAAAEERAKTGKDVATDKADGMPIDERYTDDGSISRGDKEKYSLRTGGTQAMPMIKDAARSRSGSGQGRVSEDSLIEEMKGGRNVVFVLLGVGVVVIALIIFLVVR